MRAMLRGALCLGAGGILLGAPFAASALPFSFGEIEGKFDTTLSVGATFRMQDPDASLLGITNGGTARSVNDDDGNLGFEKGDVVAAVAKATHEMELKWREYGLFTRFSYFYDQAAADASRRESRYISPGVVGQNREHGKYELGERGRDRLESEIDLLDLFVYGRFNLGGGRSLSARFGNQVVSWGESTFIQNGINSINPIDVARIRAPGAELKEALLPIPMLWSSVQLTESLSMEAVWMTSYKKTEIDPRGSFFSTNDFISDDGDKAIVSFGRREDDNSVTRPPNDPAGPGSAAVWVPRENGPGVEAAEKQFGVALRYFSDALFNTEFGLFYLNYHSRTPLVSGYRGGTTHSLNAGPAPTCSQNPAISACRASYFSEYPANIELYGLSFNTDGPFGIAIQGEYSFRPKQPVQLGGTEVLLTALGLPNSINPDPATNPITLGDYIQGWREVETHQAQVTLTKAFGPTLGAQQFIMLGEVGFNHLALPDNLRFNGPGAGLPACGFQDVGTSAAVSNGSCQSDGFATDSSWGYRLVNRMDFENVLGALGISPRLVLAHDVNGVGPNFNQGTKAVTVGVGFNYLQRWQADIGYTTFFGGRTYSGTDPVPLGATLAPGVISPGDSNQLATFATSANPNKDRDFLAISVSYAF